MLGTSTADIDYSDIHLGVNLDNLLVLLNIEIKTKLERLIELKNYFEMDSKKEEFILKYLDISLKESVEED